MFAEVLVEIKSLYEKTFTYHIPNGIDVFIGSRVIVPFGNRNIRGLVLNILDSTIVDTKDIIDIIDKKAILNDELFLLGKYMSNKYLCSLMSSYETMLPNALKFNNNKTSIKYENYIVKIADLDNPSKGESTILNMFINSKKVKRSMIKNKAILKRLIEKGILSELKEEVYRLESNVEKRELYTLTEKQNEAFLRLKNSNKSVCLFRGVTGSGKTEIYMHLIKNVLSQNKTAIVLVPEISLTTQLIGRFRSVFDNIAVLHSGLSDGERYDEYRKISEGMVNLVIGTRSAIFAPLKNIGLIVIDECHDDSYKQDNNPRYNTIDIALERIKYNNAKLILGSATPDLCDYAKGMISRYELVELLERVNNINLPDVKVIDMKDEMKKGNSILSEYAKELIIDRLNKNEQIMILINRRGYSNYVICRECGEVVKCPNCDITLTYHKSSDTLRCHYCGYGMGMLIKCNKCNSKYLMLKGIGTEKIEEYLNENFNARVIRMDRDSTSNKGSHEKIIEEFNNHKYDILLGTQMISKGFDFPLVTLVIVLNGDSSLNIPDYRSAEKTFNMLTQVSGRAGRKYNGISVIQTYNPDHYSIELSRTHDYKKFYNHEIAIRKKLFYPPFCNIVSLRILSNNYDLGMNEIKKIDKYLRENLNNNYIVLGPSVSLKINNIYKFQLIVKYKDNEILYKVLNEIQNHIKSDKIKFEIDFNPGRL